MSTQKKEEFQSITSDILNHKEFLKLKTELHHGISRYEHSKRVAKMAYSISKFLNLDYEKITRAALLHDFFLDEETKDYTKKQTLVKHPEIALKNAKKYFTIDERQENVITSHMFPLSKTLPKYKESYVVSISDKLVATHEMYRYKAVLQLGIYMIFIFNMLSIVTHIE